MNITCPTDNKLHRKIIDKCKTIARKEGIELRQSYTRTLKALYRDQPYLYDANGRMTVDPNKKISRIEYNFLHLPGRITMQNGDRVEYVYDASGVKHRETHVSGATASTREYAGNKVFESNALKLVINALGYAEKAGSVFNRYYYLKDWQGNNRMVLNAAGGIVQATNYYPFGSSFAESPARSDQHVQPYKFNGKVFGLDFYDYSARIYSPELTRFLTMDPLAEKYYSTSPYAYCLNNPVKYIDPTGCDTVPANEVWNYDQVNFSSDGTGIHDDEYIPVIVDGVIKYKLHKISSGENEGNYMAIEQHGVDEETGIEIYEYKYIVGKDKLEDFKKGDTKVKGIKQSIVRYAMNNGVDGRKNIWGNLANGWFNIVTDPANWIPSPLDLTNYLPKSFYQTSKGATWNQFRTQTKGQYTTKNYGTYQNAVKARSIDYKKQK